MLLYQFEENGVGCKAHGDDSCLCDVTPLPGGVPIRKLPELAPFPAGDDSPSFSFMVWASMTLGRFEALAGIDETALNEALRHWEGREAKTKSIAAAGRRTAVVTCLRAGLTFEQTARWLSTSTSLVMDELYPRERHEQLLQLEPLIRSGKMNSNQIAEQCGVEPRYVVALASRWHVKLPHAGRRLHPEMEGQARELVKSGMSRRAAARKLGISESRVVTWCLDLPDHRKRKESK